MPADTAALLTPLFSLARPHSKEDTDFDIQQYVTPKTEHEKARIAEAIKASFLFQHISPANRELLFSVMEKVKVQKGDWVIRQGDEGDRFYIVDNGKFEVRIQSDEKVRGFCHEPPPRRPASNRSRRPSGRRQPEPRRRTPRPHVHLRQPPVLRGARSHVLYPQGRQHHRGQPRAAVGSPQERF